MALARLLLRINALSHSARHSDGGTVTRPEDAHWTIADLKPPSPLLAGMRDCSLPTAIKRVLEVQARLLTACASNDAIDPLWVCRVLLALGDDFAQTYPPAVPRA